MGTHNPCFGSKIIKILYIFTPLFVYIKLGLKGYTFQGHVFLMFSILQSWNFSSRHDVKFLQSLSVKCRSRAQLKKYVRDINYTEFVTTSSNYMYYSSRETHFSSETDITC